MSTCVFGKSWKYQSHLRVGRLRQGSIITVTPSGEVTMKAELP